MKARIASDRFVPSLVRHMSLGDVGFIRFFDISLDCGLRMYLLGDTPYQKEAPKSKTNIKENTFFIKIKRVREGFICEYDTQNSEHIPSSWRFRVNTEFSVEYVSHHDNEGEPNIFLIVAESGQEYQERSFEKHIVGRIADPTIEELQAELEDILASDEPDYTMAAEIRDELRMREQEKNEELIGFDLSDGWENELEEFSPESILKEFSIQELQEELNEAEKDEDYEYASKILDEMKRKQKKVR